MSDKKLFKLHTIFPSGNEYTSDDIFEVEPVKMASNMAYFKDKFNDIKVKFRSKVVDKCEDEAYLVCGDKEVVQKMSLAIAAAIQLESKIEYGEELTSD